MTQRMHPRTNRFPIAALLFAVAATAALAQQAARPADVPTLPARGPLTVSAEAITEILAGIKAPPGFDVKAFATPPIVNYPTCVTATPRRVSSSSASIATARCRPIRAWAASCGWSTSNDDGQADEYTVFATMDSPRGAVFDGDTLYVSHPPFVTAFRDTDGDGIAEESAHARARPRLWSRFPRRGSHDQRHRSWDRRLALRRGGRLRRRQGGRDRRPEIQMRGGGNVRVRPDGTEPRNLLARHAQRLRRGDRSVPEPVRARQHQRRRRLRYPAVSLRRGRPLRLSVALPELQRRSRAADRRLRHGSGTGMLYVQDPGLPAPYGDALYSVDWGTECDLSPSAQPQGATFTVGQEPFLTACPSDRHGGRRRARGSLWRAGAVGSSAMQANRSAIIARLTRPGAKPPPSSRSRRRHRRAAGRARHVGQPGAPAVCAARARPPRPRRPNESRCSRNASRRRGLSRRPGRRRSLR